VRKRGGAKIKRRGGQMRRNSPKKNVVDVYKDVDRKVIFRKHMKSVVGIYQT
jgi:hypothetical protein